MARRLLLSFGWTFVFLLLSSVFEERNCIVVAHRNFVNQDQSENPLARIQYRTAYHFQPHEHWINDPNGPLYYNGIYHLFYQYNPYGAVWGNISWGHTVSTDLIHWTGLGVALSPSEPYDSLGCWSGSATILPGNKPVIVYTGADKLNRQLQNIAFPRNLSDPYLHEWYKPNNYNPLLEPVDGLIKDQFRDPTTGWRGRDGLWRMAIAALVAQKGQVLLYKSKDYVHWVRAKLPLHSTNDTGMWECPDFYSLEQTQSSGEKKYVVKFSVSETRSDHYLLGKYDGEDLFLPDNRLDDHRIWKRFDYGNFYASKSFFDEKKQRRIVWGWSNESDSSSDDVAKGWAGIQTFPRVITLDPSGEQLIQWPIEELELLRAKEPYHLQNTELKTGGLVVIKGQQVSEADVEVEFELPSLDGAEPFDPTWVFDPPKVCREKGASVGGGVGPFGLLVLASKKLEEHTALFFRVFKANDDYKVLMCADQSRSSLRPEVYKPTYGAFVDVDIKKDGKISLRALVDHSVVESFGGGGRVCITSRVYPTLLSKGNIYLYAFSNGTETVKISELKAFNVAKPQIS